MPHHTRHTPQPFTLDALEARRLLNAAFDLIGLTALRNDPNLSTIDGSGVTVAVLDAGAQATNIYIQPALLTSVNFMSDSGGQSTHGTASAGAAASRDPVASVARAADLVDLRVISDQPGLSEAHISEGLQWVIDHHAQYHILVVNISLGDGQSHTTINSTAYSASIRQLESVGVTVVSAAGNEFFTHQSQGVASPAIDSTISVGAVWQDGARSNVVFDDGAKDFTTGADRLVSFTDRWSGPTFMLAPGGNVTALGLGGGHYTEDGTSIAAPMVSGAVALMQDAAMTFAGHYLSTFDVIRILKATAHSVFDGDDENDNVSNTNASYPRLDIHAAVLEIAAEYASISVGSVAASASGANVTITASGVVSTFGATAGVDFYIDFDRDGNFTASEFVGHDSSAAGGWTTNYSLPASFPPGAFRVGAFASNALGKRSAESGALSTLVADLPFSVSYPEGWANETTVDEFLPLVNPGASAVTYRVIAHYEVGATGQVLDSILEESTIPALSRGGLTITTRGGAGQSLTTLNRGYALELQSTGPLAGTLSHYDNFAPGNPDAGVATGEALTATTASTWSIARVEKNPGHVSDFLLYFNTQDTPQTITATFYKNGVQAAAAVFTVRAHGRGGLAVGDIVSLAAGVYGVTVTAPAAFIACLSHYVTDGTGDSSLGIPALGGSVDSRGVLPLVDRSTGLDATVNIFNPGSAKITVTLTAADDATQVPVSKSFQVSGRSTLATDLSWVPGTRPLSVSYSTTAPVGIALFQNAPSRGDSIFDPGATFTSTSWAFADAFLDRSQAGTKYFETLSIFNPGAAAISVDVDFLLFDYRQDLAVGGQSVRRTQTISIPAGRAAALLLHDPASTPMQPAGAELVPFSIAVHSTAQIIASFAHWDLIQGGGWSTIGTPLDTVTRL